MSEIRTVLYKVVVLEDGGVGKTSILMRYTEQKFDERYIMTIGSNFAVKSLYMENIKINLQIWDLAGQSHFSMMRHSFYRGAKGAIYVFDLSRRPTFEELVNWITEVEKVITPLFIIVGNKVDLEDRAVTEHEAQEFAQKIGALGYFETSAKMGENVEEVFHLLARVLLNPESYKVQRSYEPESSSQSIADQIPVPESLPGQVQKIEFDEEMQKEIKITVENILTSTPSLSEGFRILIAGDEEAQKPFLTQLFSVGSIEWPPQALDVLYGTIKYDIVLGRCGKQTFTIYLLSNLNKLTERQNLFFKACQNARALIIFYSNEKNELDFMITTISKIREKFPDLEIALIGKDPNFISFPEKKKLKKKYGLEFFESFDSAAPRVVVNILEDLEEEKEEAKYYLTQIEEIQEQIRNQKISPMLGVAMIQKIVESKEQMDIFDSDSSEGEISEPIEKACSEYFVYVSYSLKDLERFQIPKIVETLEKHPAIKKAIYWEKDSGIDIIEYMNKNLGKCNSFILFCSEHTTQSKAVETEWMAAYKEFQDGNTMLKIIPIFEKPEHIPFLLRRLVRVYYNQENLEKTVTDITNLMLK